MILIEHILGNAKKDPVWKQKLEGANVDLLVLDQREAQKSRCRRTSAAEDVRIHKLRPGGYL